MENVYKINFVGPFSWIDQQTSASIYDVDISKKPGIYLWTIEYNGSELVYYVGETGRSFKQRLTEHFQQHCSGAYHLYDPAQFTKGEKKCLWPGRYDPNHKTSVKDFINQAENLFPVIIRLFQIYRFFLAPIECDKRTRNRIEAAIAKHLYDQPGIVGQFQDTGIRYSSKYEDEPEIKVKIASSNNLIGLSSEILA